MLLRAVVGFAPAFLLFLLAALFFAQQKGRLLLLLSGVLS